ncbi:MAG: S-layer homology domain-containing protein [Dysosmobacter sp.]|nr:S-layer homology domain-containing protein [Dysosmobacter sp.]
MKQTAKRLLSMALAFVMVLSLLPAMSVTALADEEGEDDSTTKDAFGIAMTEWTEAEKQKAEGELPYGTGYGTWTTLMEMGELYVSMGYDGATRLTGLLDWNEKEGTTDAAIGSNVINFTQKNLTSRSESYKAVTTAGMDLCGTGKKEYVANLALNASGNTLYLYVTDSNNKVVGSGQQITFEHVSQLSGMEVHQVKGAFSVTAGDFDGDGKDSIVVYVPQTGASGHTQGSGDKAPFIAEYFMGQDYTGQWIMVQNPVSTVCSNVLQLLGNNEINKIDTMKNQPMVDLVAEDVDKDGFDELIVTAGMNDVTNSDHYLESRVFIYDKLSKKTTPAEGSTEDGNWHRSYDKKQAITSESNKRVVWASSTVGNIDVSTGTNSVDYPEIITAGFIDGEQSKTQHINVDGSDEIGVTAVRVDDTKTIDQSNTFTIWGDGKSTTAINVICQYEEILNQKLSPNGWTKGGFFESEDVNSLLQVQAYADRGLEYAEAVFISGSVYHINSNGKLEEEYRHTDFGNKDCGAGSDTLTNTTITAVTAGNFNANSDGREQLIFVTTLKQSGKNNAYSRVYCYYYDTTLETKDGKEQEHGYEGKRSSYLTEHKGSFYVSLNTLDTDNDSVIAKLDSVTREYGMPDVLAILESTPYFTEIGDGEDGVGNSETVYGKSVIEGGAKGESFGFTAGLITGFEAEFAKYGIGVEVHLDNSFNWSTTKSKEVEWGVEFKNDTGDNLVVVYRSPVIVYHYVDLDGNEMVVGKTGQPAYSMVTVDEYNEAAEQFGLDQISDENAKLATPGEPSTYRSNINNLSDAAAHQDWVNYPNNGTTSEYLTCTETSEKAFEQEFNVSLSVVAKIKGVLLGYDLGFTTTHSWAKLNGKSVTKSGSVNPAYEDGYSFQWKLATWDCQLNGSTVPVVGYLVRDVSSPPSPAMGLTAETTGTDSVTLRWTRGARRATQYRVYRLLDTGEYVLVGAVQGDQTTCTLTGLEPGETYTYVVRGVGFVGGEALESVNSGSITVRTQSEGSKVRLNLVGESLTSDNVLQSTGAQAKLSMEVSGTDGGSISYQWQVLESSAEGLRKGWHNADTLDDAVSAGETKLVGTVSGAKSGTLTLSTIDRSLNGSSLRCVVTITSRAGNVATYYSPSVTLDLDGLDTTTEVTVTEITGAAIGGSGTIADPYTGTASYTQVTKNVTTVYVPVPATAAENGTTYTVYQDEENSAYVGVYDTVDTAAGTASCTYRAVTEDNGTFTLGAALELSGDRYVVDSGVYTVPADFTGSSIYEDATTSYYEKQYVVTTGESTTTLTAYWYNTGDGKYYIKNESGAFVLPASQPDKYTDAEGEVHETGADLRMAYYDAGGTVILGAEGTDGYDHYQVYTYSEENAGYTLSASFHCVPGTVLRSDGTDYADSAKLVTVTVNNTVDSITYTTSPVTGTQLSLSAGVEDSTGATVSTRVLYTITNTATGAATQFAAYDGTSTWTAPQYGLYRIEAAADATATTKASSAVCYYLADDPTNDYRLSLWQGGQVTNITYNGESVALKLEKRVYDGENPTSSWENVDSGVSYQVDDSNHSGSSYTPTPLSGSSYTPAAAGSYLFSALVDGKTVASALLSVSKIPITVRPVWDSREGNINTVPNFSDIYLEAKDIWGNDISVDDVMTVSCDLYEGGSIKQNAASGTYTVTPAYKNNDVKSDFLSRYSVTMDTDTIYYISEAITVYFNAGENGELYARYVDPSGTEFAFDSGSQISMDYGLKFVAEPEAGWSVESSTGWKVKLGSSAVSGCYSVYSNTLEITGTQLESLKNLCSSLNTKELTVSVAFTNQTNTITYSAGDSEGSLQAVTGTEPFTSGGSVAHNAAVTFTAAPNAGKMVEKWTVDGTEYKWDGTDALYRENTLTLENISASHDVQVYFTDMAVTNVSAAAMDTANNLYLGAAITVTDAQGNTITGDALKSVPQSDALTFTAEIGNSTAAVIKEWQTSADDTNWTTVAGSGGQNSITVYEHGEKLYVRVVIAVAQTYQLSWKVMEGDTEITDQNIAVLIPRNGNVTLGGNGSNYAVNTPVEFTLRLDGSRYVVGWSDNVTPAEDGMSATMTLTDDTVVTVSVAKKPTVSWTNGTGGTVSVKGTVNGKANTTVSNGGYVDYNTTVTVTLKPSEGYEVSSGINADYTDGTGDTTDDKFYTISNVQADQTITPAWTALKKYTIVYSVVDTNGDEPGGKNGTLSASASRKDMAPFAVYEFDEVYEGSMVSFTAVPDEDYCVKEWTVEMNGTTTHPMSADDEIVLENISADADVTVQFTYLGSKVIASAGENGALVSALVGENDVLRSITGDGILLNDGVSVQLTAEPDEGYEVESWLVNGKAVSGERGTTYTYVADGSGARIAVTFRAVKYSVSWGAENGAVQAAGYSGSSASVRGGTSVTFTAVPDDGYVVGGWAVNGIRQSGQTGSTFTWTVPAGAAEGTEYEIEAILVGGTYRVAVTDPAHGTISAEPDVTGGVTGGTSVTFTANAESGYIVAGWTVNGQTTMRRSNTHTVTIKGDTTVTAVVVPEKYEVAYSVNESAGGTISAEGYGASPAEVPYDGSVTFTAVPNTGAYYYIQAWQVDGRTVTNDTEGVAISTDKTTLTLSSVTSVHTVEAIFAKMTAYSVSYQVIGSGGSLGAAVNGEPLTLTPGQSADVWGNSTVVFTASPAENNMVKAWKINDVVQENLSNTLTIDALRGNILVTVEFEPLMLHSIPNPGKDTGCTISNIIKTPSDYGEANQIRDRGTVTFTVAPNSGKYLTELTVNGTDCLTSTGTSGSENQLTIRNNGDGSFTITVANVKKNITLTATALEFQTFKEELSTVPTELQAAYSTVAELQTALRAEVKQIDSKVPDSQTALFDIVLKYTTDGGITWAEADKDHFPAGGITVFIPYSDLGGTDSSYTFTVIHMFTTDMNGHKIGDTERITPAKTAAGIQFTVTSLSPFAIGWSKYTAPSGGGGGGGGGAASAETVIIKDSVNGKVTADNTCAEEGDTVTLTVEPGKGYTLETLTVTDKNGNELKLKDKGDGKYTFTMPDSKVTIKATFMEDNSMLNFFVDVPADAYYYDAVLWAAKEGITGGTDAVHFSPNATCTRAQAVTFLWRAAGSPAPKSHAMPFTDVAEGSYYETAVLWAVENGITKGTSDTTFTPNAKCTRAQIVTFLWRSQKSPASGSVNPFTDVAADAYYTNAVLWAVEHGITAGTTATTFSPNNDCTRAQIVTFLYRCMK